jgi:broad-specificity NMP kinase
MSGKTLVIVNGTMGVGKTTTCRLLLERLTPGAYLDGDWCWNINPFAVTTENQDMVIGNIVHLLRGYLTNTSLRYVIFGWVLHKSEIFDAVLRPLEDLAFETHKVTLTCSPAQLSGRLSADVAAGHPQADVIERAVARLALYDTLDTSKLDVGTKSAAEAADEIAGMVQSTPL